MAEASNDLVIQWRQDEVLGWTALQRGMQASLAKTGLPVVRRQPTEFIKTFARGLAKAGLVRRVATFGRPRLVTLSWASDGPAWPDAYWCELIPWLYDCWEPDFPRWEAMIRRNRVRLAFFTARVAAEHFRKAIPGLETYWLPECQDFSLLYPNKPLAARPLHVLEMGRRLATVHDKIREPLEKAGKTHVYDRQGVHASAVPGLDALYKRMGDAAIVVCYPKSITHPASAGKVETMTQRYLEAFGSGCLAVGYCPKELSDLFGFDPVIALPEADPASQILSVLDSLEQYQEHADRCRRRAMEVGSFDVRAAEMLRIVRARGQTKA